MIKTIQDKKFNNTIVTYVTTMKVMTKNNDNNSNKKWTNSLNSLIIKPWVFT